MSEPRFVALLPTLLLPLTASPQTHLGAGTGLSCIDATKRVVCHTARRARHRVFAGRAPRGKPATGGFSGFKGPLGVKDRGERGAFCLPPGPVDARRPVPKRARRRFGQRVGDSGDLSQPLAEPRFVTPGLHSITRRRPTRHTRLLAWSDPGWLRQRAISEPRTDQLKHRGQIEPTRHRRPVTCLVNLVAGLMADCHQPKNPSLHRGPLALPPASLIQN